MIALRSRRVGLASSVVLALVAVLFTWFATRSEGESVRKADLNDGGVWVTNAGQSRFGRLNKPAGQLDAAVAATTPDNTGLDVVQDGAAVLGITRATNQATPINTRAGILVESATLTLPTAAPTSGASAGGTGATGGALPVALPIDLRGGTAAVVEPTTGKVRAQRVDTARGIGGLDQLQAAAKPLATVGGSAVLAVGVDGSVYAVSAASGQLAVLRPLPAGGFTEPAMSDLGFTAPSVQLTVVGTRWVVFDPATGLMRADGLRSPIDLGSLLGDLLGSAGTAYTVVQQPGDDAAGVLVATDRGAASVGFDGSVSGRIGLPASAAGGRLWLAAPVRLGRCVNATWAAATMIFYGRNCEQDHTDAVTIEDPVPATNEAARPPRTDGVRLRVNRGQLVLNDIDTGGLWDVDTDHPVKIDDWASVIPPPRSGNENVKPNPQDNADEQAHRPPEANADELQVRAGRTSTLHVLDNDTDSQGSVLAISPGDVSATDVAGFQVSASVDGQTISISVPDKPAAAMTHFTYWVNNGTNGPEGRAQGSVTVTVVDDSINTPPHLRSGKATVAGVAVPVVKGGHTAVAVLADWRDDENDPVIVEGLDQSSSVDGAGALAVTAPGQAGALDVKYRVDDGRGGRTEAKVTVKVLGDSDAPVAPVAQPDVVRAVVGKPVQIQPLGNDTPGADPSDPGARMRLAAEIRGPSPLMLDTNLATGVVTVTGSAPGSYLLTYAAQVGAAVGAGRFRVDVLAPPTGDAPPVAAPDAATIRDQSPTIADVLVNDYSPRSDVLAIQSVATTETWLQAWVIQGRWLRVQATTPMPGDKAERRGVLTYTISDGTRTAAGELSVVQKPTPPDTVLPTVVDDQAVVRWGDVVTIPALDNDSMADGVPLKLNASAVKVITGGGQVYATGSVLRYLPDPQAISRDQTAILEYAAYPEGMPARAVSARVTVTVKPLPTATTPDLPPTARDFSATVTAGEAITLTVPTSGIDPDGDLGFVSGVVGEAGGPVDLRLGRVVSFGASAIRYESYPSSSGTEVVRYVVMDRFGKSGEGLIRVGVVQPGAPQPPVAVADDVVAAPGRTVTVDPFANDLVPRGTDPVLEDTSKINDPVMVADFAKQPDSTFKVTVPEEGPSKLYVYGIDGGLFDPSRAEITVRGRKGFNNPPVAVDDVARPVATPAGDPGKAGGDPAAPGQQGVATGVAPLSVVVDVLSNDRDIDGDHGDLKVVEVGDGASITPDGVRVSFSDFPRAIPYVIEDGDGGRAMAVIYVPANGSDNPYPLTAKTITMDKDATVKVVLADYIGDPRGRTVKVTTPDRVSTSPSATLAATQVGSTELSLTSSGGYVGPGALMLEVTDRTGVDDPAPHTAYVIVPVQVGPLTPLLRCPQWEVNVVAGSPARVIDIPRLCSAWFPEGLDPASVEYAVNWDAAVDKVTMGQTDQGGRKITLSAAEDALHGAKGSLLVGVKGSSEHFPLRVRVTSLRVDPSAAAPGAVTQPPPLATMRPARVEGLIAGQTAIVNLAQYLDSPFGSLHCTVETARMSSATGSGISAAPSGCLLRVSASADATGVTTFVLDVSDAPDRLTTGTVTVSVLSRPGPPMGVSAVADRAQGGSALVRFSPPAYDGGLPVLEYLVSAPGVPPRVCDSSPCTVSGLTNGVAYVFSVQARNAAGLSEPGVAGSATTPDTLPGLPGINPVGVADGALTISWDLPPNEGSALVKYRVQLSGLDGSSRAVDVPAGSTSTTVSGLDNEVVYKIFVTAFNGLGPGPTVETSGQSAGRPGTVTPRLSFPAPTPDADTALLSLSWDAVRPNGPGPVEYTVWRQVGGGGWDPIKTVGDTRYEETQPFNGTRVSYAVTAVNHAGLESDRGPNVVFNGVGVPETPTSVAVTTPNADKKMVLSFSLGNSHGSGWKSFTYRTPATGPVTLPCTNSSTCSFSATLDNGSIDPQALTLSACNLEDACSLSSAPVAFHPYGPTLPVVALAPSYVKKAGGKFDVTFAWKLVDNGRDVSATVDDPACNVDNAGTSCTVRGVGYATKVTVAVTATSAAGPAAPVSMSITTPAKLDPTVTIKASGDTCFGPGECGASNADTCPAGTSCEFLALASSNWDSPTMKCTFSVAGKAIGSTLDSFPTNTTKVTAVAYGAADQITVSCSDTASPTTNETNIQNSITWHDVTEPTGPTPTTP